jgi:hypothetical protein
MQLSMLFACLVAVAAALTTSATTKSTVVTVRLFFRTKGQALIGFQSESTLHVSTTNTANMTTSHISTATAKVNSTVTLAKSTNRAGNTGTTTTSRSIVSASTSGPAKVTGNAAVRAYGPSAVALAGFGGLLAAFI